MSIYWSWINNLLLWWTCLEEGHTSCRIWYTYATASHNYCIQVGSSIYTLIVIWTISRHFRVLMFSCIFHRKLQSALALASVRVLVFYVCCTQSTRFVLFALKEVAWQMLVRFVRILGWETLICKTPAVRLILRASVLSVCLPLRHVFNMSLCHFLSFIKLFMSASLLQAKKY